MNNYSIDEFIDEIIKIEEEALSLKKNAEINGVYSASNAKKIENDVINKMINLLEDGEENVDED